MQLQRLNIAIIPPAPVARRARTLSAKLPHRLFTLDAKHHPHLTLYMSDFPASKRAHVLARVGALAQTMSPMRVTASALRASSGGYVEVRYKRSPALNHMQAAIVGRLNPLRRGTSAFRESAASFSPEEQRATRRFGYPAIGRAFRPHLTLSRQRRSGLVPRASVRPFSFEVGRLGVFLVGPHGTCKKLLGSFPLQQ